MTEYKSYKIETEGTYCLYVVKHTGKGSLPDALSGTFTKESLAKDAIDRYLDKKEEKVTA